MSLSLCIYLLFWVVCVCVQMGGAHLDIYTQEIMLMWQASFDQRWPKTSAKLSRWWQVQFTRGILRLNKKFTYRSCCSCYHSLDWDTPNVSRFDPKPSAMSTVSSRMSKKVAKMSNYFQRWTVHCRLAGVIAIYFLTAYECSMMKGFPHKCHYFNRASGFNSPISDQSC